ncbi:MAG: amino acid-binding protein [Lentisphaerae bacterium]|nr:amino acid-binding protein [Lentisphaerota bacterium]
MKIQQLSLVLENRPGTLAAPIEALAKAEINITTLCLAEYGDSGILRLIIPDWRRAKQVLEEAGFAVTVTDVLALDVADKPGGLAGVLRICAHHKLSIEYMYAFTEGSTSTLSHIIDGPAEQRALLVFRFADPDAAVTALAIEQERISVVDSVQLFGTEGTQK